MNQHELAGIKYVISGEVVRPSDLEYGELSKVFVRAGSPAVIMRCQDNDAVAAAIQFARENQLELSVRSGGHSFSGLSTNDGGLVIDLSYFNAVEVIDPAQNIVRIGAGARWGDAAKALDAHGLAISSGDTNSVGVGGLTLGGGIGWMVRKYGLTIDSLEAAEIVLADGHTLRVSAKEYPDLFWAIRGGGGNFGVATSFDFRAHSIQSALGGMVIYPTTELEFVLTNWADYMRGAPEELNSTFVVFSGFGPETPPSLMVLVCYGGDDEDAAHNAVKPLLKLGAMQHQDIQRKPYYKMLEDSAMPPGLKPAGQNGFVKTFSKDVIEAIVTNYGRAGTPILQIRSLGGAMNRISPDATAFAHRGYEAFISAASLIPADTPDEQTERIRRESWRPLEPFTEGAYVNFLTDVGEANMAAAYPTATYNRLAEIKAVYDPENIFNQNANIEPAKK
jgi:FAD/FMN-containing dehydrogenase